MSHRVVQVLSQFSPDLENYSIDESFLVMPPGDPRITGDEIKRRVIQRTGIPVSVGIAAVKTLAKLANHLAKPSPRGVYLLTADDPVHDKVDLAEVWGAGPTSSRKLHAAEINTGRELQDADDPWVLQTLSIVGLRLDHELRGISCLSLEQIREPKKGCASRAPLARLSPPPTSARTTRATSIPGSRY